MRVSTPIFILITALLSACTATQTSTPLSTTPADRTISADLRQIKGPLNPMFKSCVGAGRANEALRADWQKQLAELHEQCGFTYLRMHGIFCDDMGVYREDKAGQPQYNWQYIDQVYDFLVSIHMKPFVELSFCPSALASGPQTVFWWKGNATQPKNPQKWHDLVRAFLTHLRERYGDKEVRSWYFEVWNEPNLAGFFFIGTQQDYFNLYVITALAIKSVSPHYKVGGPATAGCAWVPEFINFCAKNSAPVDFISTHDYAVNAGAVDADGNAGTIFSSNPTAIYSNVLRIRKQITDSPLPALELHFTEWSSSYTPTDPIHDTYVSAPFILDKIKNAGDAAQSMSYWTFTDIFEENGPRFTPFHGGFGLLNYQAIRKPAFYAYQFLNRLGPIELQNADPASYICKDNAGDIQALLWNFTPPKPNNPVIDQIYYKRDLPPTTQSTTTLHLTNLPNGTYTLDTYRVGYHVNDAYAAYQALGSPDQLTKSQVAQIQSQSNGTPTAHETITIHNGQFDHTFTLRENDVFLFLINKRR
jgi:xylan 1,4-beta-xylosidase